MARGVLHIDASAVQKQVIRLEQLSRSAMPVAVRASLNSAAFDVKTRTMPVTAKTFVQRNPTFFKSQSKVVTAKGMEVNGMIATVGFVPANNAAKESGGATQDLEEQEEGGVIGGRTFIPLPTARIGNNANKAVQTMYRLRNIKANIFDSSNKNIRAKNAKERYVIAAYYAKAYGGYLIGNRKGPNGNKNVSRIDSIIKVGGKSAVAATPLYSVKKGRRVKVKPTRFMEKASLESGKRIEEWFCAAAEKQFLKFGTK